MTLPQDPFMLLSMVNMKLRDEFASIEELCKANDLDQSSLVKTLKDAGFEYQTEINQFR